MHPQHPAALLKLEFRQSGPEEGGPNTAAHHNPKLARLVDQVYDTLLDADAWPRALIVIADAPESDARVAHRRVATRLSQSRLSAIGN
jgi:hypothetical protein